MPTRSLPFLLAVLFLVPATFAQDTDPMAQLAQIHNYVEISDDLSTSGQISYDDIAVLKDAGFEVVINLAPADSARNGEEGFRVVQAGMTYVHIPVSWREPSPRDLQLFFDVMNANADRKVFVHCFANMRVSAFVYLYRRLEQQVDAATAQADMNRIWDPYAREQWAQWATLIDAALGAD